MAEDYAHPSKLMLWLSSGCNARCVTCEIWRDETVRRLSADEIDRWAPEWRALGVRTVELAGEPTIHPELRRICTALRQAEIEICFLSNGILLEKFANVIAAEGVSLTVSLDGPRETHDKVRGKVGAFDRLRKGVAAVRQRRPDIQIFGRCAVHRLNFRELAETAKTAHELGLSSISFFPHDKHSSAFGRERIEAAEWATRAEALALGDEDTLEVSVAIDRLETECGSLLSEKFIVESIEYLRRELIVDDGGYTLECNAPYTSAVIEPDGGVRPCWFLPAYGRLGRTTGLQDLINSSSARAFRRELDVATNPVCKSCVCPQVVDSDGRSRSGRFIGHRDRGIKGRSGRTLPTL